VEALHRREVLRGEDRRAGDADLSGHALPLRVAPAGPAPGVEVAAAHAHRQCGPDDRLDVHLARHARAAEGRDQALEPGQVEPVAPLRNADVDVVCQRHGRLVRGHDHLVRQQAARALPHQREARLRGRLEGEPVREIEVRIEDDHLLARPREQRRIGDLAPAGMAFAKGADQREAGIERGGALVGVALGPDAPVLAVVQVDLVECLGDRGLVRLVVGDQRQVEGLQAVGEQAAEREPRVGQRAWAQDAVDPAHRPLGG
jgi:hypothetical protein